MAFKRGRATILTKELVEKIAGYIEDGNYIDVAVTLAGVSRVSFYEWMRKGAAIEKIVKDEPKTKLGYSDQMYLLLLNRVEKANAIAENKRLHGITDAADKDPKWAAWFLERRFSERWGAKQNIKIQSDSEITHQIEFDLSILNDEELEFLHNTLQTVKKYAERKRPASAGTIDTSGEAEACGE